MLLNRFTDYTKLDQTLFEIAGAIETNMIKFINPQNLDEQKTKFFNALEQKEVYNPQFSYTPRNPIYSYFSMSPKLETFKTELKEMLKEVEHTELGIIFESEIIDLIEKIEMIKSIGTENFSGSTESYYENISKEEQKAAKEILQNKYEETENIIPFQTAIDTIQEFLKKKKLPYHITIREPAGSRFAVINSKKEILINKDTIFTKEMLKRLIAHEIETHIYRYENGLKQPYKILAHGFSRETTQTEEGLAVCIEKLKGVSSKNQIREYAGRTHAIHTAESKNFFDTFIEMQNYFDNESAFRLTLRAKRGIKDQEKKGAFFKDAVYFKGMIQVDEFLKEHKVEELYYGKYSIYDIPLVKSIPGLKNPKYLPF